MTKVSLMKIPQGFKIKKKVDVDKFINNCMQNDSEYEVVINAVEKIVISKEKDGSSSFKIKMGDIRSPFVPLIEVADTNNPSYKHTVTDWVWKYRKYINKKWFND